MTCVLVCFFFKQKTAYEMRISDWSSDVCSSDLVTLAFRTGKLNRTTEGFSGVGKCDRPIRHYASAAGVVFMISFCLRMDSLWISSNSFKIGRASCRERVCQYV